MKLKQRNAIRKITGAACEGAAAKGLRTGERSAAEMLQRDSVDWITDRTVQAIGIGAKTTAGQDTGAPCVKIYVTRKQPASLLRNPVPPTIRLADSEAYPTDVVEVGKIELQAAYTSIARPLHAGVSVANQDRDAGTLGVFVQARGQPDRQYILSNYHVLAPFVGTQERTILQPAEQDGGRTTDVIAHFERAVPMHFNAAGHPNIGDAAIARLKSGISFRTRMPYIGHLKGHSGIIRLNGIVRMIGRTSGFHSGRVTDIDVRARLDYPTRQGGTKFAGLDKLVACTPYSEPGDSGSAIVNSADYLVGLHVAGNESISMFNRIVPIFRSLAIELISGDQPLEADDIQPDFDLAGLVQPHRIFNSVSWCLTRQGLEVDGVVKGTSGKLVTVPKVFDQFRNDILSAAVEYNVPAELIIATYGLRAYCSVHEFGGKKTQKGRRVDTGVDEKLQIHRIVEKQTLRCLGVHSPLKSGKTKTWKLIEQFLNPKPVEDSVALLS